MKGANPCKKCGSRNLDWVRDPHSVRTWLKCHLCGFEGPRSSYDLTVTIAAWNRANPITEASAPKDPP